MTYLSTINFLDIKIPSHSYCIQYKPPACQDSNVSDSKINLMVELLICRIQMLRPYTSTIFRIPRSMCSENSNTILLDTGFGLTNKSSPSLCLRSNSLELSKCVFASKETFLLKLPPQLLSSQGPR